MNADAELAELRLQFGILAAYCDAAMWALIADLRLAAPEDEVVQAALVHQLHVAPLGPGVDIIYTSSIRCQDRRYHYLVLVEDLGKCIS